MGIHADGPYQGFSDDGQRLFDELERVLKQPNGLQQLFAEFGRRAVCDAIMSEEPPMNALTVDEIQAMLHGFIKSRPNMVHRKFDFVMSLLREETPTE
jgi:hypothetical protein